MYPSSLLDSANAATCGFLAGLEPEGVGRIEVKASGPDGMQLLCAAEAMLSAGLSSRPVRELVWLTGGGAGHSLHLLAFGAAGGLVAEAVHDFPA